MGYAEWLALREAAFIKIPKFPEIAKAASDLAALANSTREESEWTREDGGPVWLNHMLAQLRDPPDGSRGTDAAIARYEWAKRLRGTIKEIGASYPPGSRVATMADALRKAAATFLDGKDQQARHKDLGLQVGNRTITPLGLHVRQRGNVGRRGAAEAVHLLHADRWLTDAIGKDPKGKQLLAALRADVYDEPRWNVAFDMADDLGHDAEEWRRAVAQSFQSMWG